jgi:hypothetical protein
MDRQRMMGVNSCQRTMSSGMVFDGKLSVRSKSNKASRLNGILLRLIEEEMELTVRSQKCLNNAGIRLIGQLVQKPTSELLDLGNFGRKSLREIEKVLTEMDLTLEMNFDFPPWNGDGNGAELIQILSLQHPGGGFYIDDNAAKALGIDSQGLIQALEDGSPAHIGAKPSISHTKYLLNRLESKFEKDILPLADFIKTQRRWLAKSLK